MEAAQNFRRTIDIPSVYETDLTAYGQNIGTRYFPDAYGLIHSLSAS